MEISVIITTKNRCELLKLAVESVQKQTYTDFECVVVDDGSTDATAAYMNALIKQDDRFRYLQIPQEESRGGNYARNQGIRHTTGKYVAFLDDDDKWMEEKLELQKSFLDKNSDIGLVYCQVIREYMPAGIQRKMISDMAYRGDCSQKVFTHIPCTTSTMMVRRKVLLEAGLFDESMRFWQEYDLCIRICQITKIDFVKKYLVIWRCDKADKNRMTNKLVEWGKAVKQQNHKYRKEIEHLSEGARKARKQMILSDAVMRSYNSNDKRASRFYLWKIYQLTKQKEDFFAWLLNDTSNYT